MLQYKKYIYGETTCPKIKPTKRDKKRRDSWEKNTVFQYIRRFLQRILVLDKMFDEGASCKLFLLIVLFACDTYAISPSGNFVYDGDVQYEDTNNTLSEVSMLSGYTSTISCCINCFMDTSCNAVEICSTPSEKKFRLGKGIKNTTGTVAVATCKRFKMVSIFFFLIFKIFLSITLTDKSTLFLLHVF